MIGFSSCPGLQLPRDTNELNPGICRLVASPYGALTSLSPFDLMQRFIILHSQIKTVITAKTTNCWRKTTMRQGLIMVKMRWNKRLSSLFAEFLSFYRCNVSHVVDAALRKINRRARTAKTRELDGAFGWLSEIRRLETEKKNTSHNTSICIYPESTTKTACGP